MQTFILKVSIGKKREEKRCEIYFIYILTSFTTPSFYKRLWHNFKYKNLYELKYLRLLRVDKRQISKAKVKNH